MPTKRAEEKSKLKCKICARDAENHSFCVVHRKAHENVTKKYETWKRALEISWKEYLSEIVKNPLTGEWAKEVAEYLIKCGEQ
jgi:hypothetical protein